MTTVPITVAIPVGPHASNRRWLGDCLASIAAQTARPEAVLVVDDSQPAGGALEWSALSRAAGQQVLLYAPPWRLGVAHAFNFGVALAPTEHVVMLGSDDLLLPTCLEQCWATWTHVKEPLGYYYLGVRYSDGRPDQNTPCNAAMVTKALWKHTGGFPVESAAGACDTMLLSIMLASDKRYGDMYQVSPEVLYWYRVHPETDTVQKRSWAGMLMTLRHLLTEERAV